MFILRVKIGDKVFLERCKSRETLKQKAAHIFENGYVDTHNNLYTPTQIVLDCPELLTFAKNTQKNVSQKTTRRT